MTVDISEHENTTVLVIVVCNFEVNCTGHQISIKNDFIWCKDQLYPLGNTILRLTSGLDHIDLRKYSSAEMRQVVTFHILNPCLVSVRILIYLIAHGVMVFLEVAPCIWTLLLNFTLKDLTL